MSMRFEYIDAAQAVLTTRVYGEQASDGERVTHAHIALEVHTPLNGNGVILSGGRDELIELGTRIIEAAIVGDLRREGAFKK